MNPITYIYLTQAITSIILFGGVAFAGIWITEKGNPFKLCALDKSLTWKQVGFIIAAILVVQPLIELLQHWNQMIDFGPFFRMLDEQADQITKLLLGDTSFGRVIVNVVVIALIPAFVEELMFRGWLQRRLENIMNFHAAVWVTALVFSLIHLQMSGCIPRLMLGAMLGYSYHYTKTLWGSVLMHFVNNAFAVLTFNIILF